MRASCTITRFNTGVIIGGRLLIRYAIVISLIESVESGIQNPEQSIIK